MRRSTLALLLALAPAALCQQTIGLTGIWKLHLPEKEVASPAGLASEDEVTLPSMITAQGFGEKPPLKTQWSGGGCTYRDLFTEYQSVENFKFPFFLQPPHTIEITFPKCVTLAGLQFTQRQDGSRNGQVKELLTTDEAGTKLAHIALKANSIAEKVLLPQVFSGTKLNVICQSSHTGPFASFTEIAPLLPKKKINNQ